MLTGKNIDAINEFIERWDAGERGFTGRHDASERLLVKGLRELGVAIKTAYDIKSERRGRTKKQRYVKKGWSDDARRKASETLKAKWADPDYRAKCIKSISAARKKEWADPDIRQKRLDALRAAHARPERRDAASQRMKAMWAAAKSAQMQAAE